MKQKLRLVLILSIFCSDILACSCFVTWNDSFRRTAEMADLVMLVKVSSHDLFVDDLHVADLYSDDVAIPAEARVPYLISAEVVRVFKGKYISKQIQIVGDNGILCRPYLDTFKIGDYFLLAPSRLSYEDKADYELNACLTDFLRVDYESKEAVGNYSLVRNRITLAMFESKLKHGDWDLTLISLILLSAVTYLIVKRKKKKTNANKA